MGRVARTDFDFVEAPVPQAGPDEIVARVLYLSVDPTKPVVCVPILRAGLVLLEQAATVLPAQVTYHFGASRAPRASTQKR